jgi:hypothetical protein
MPCHALMNVSTMKQYNKALLLIMILGLATVCMTTLSCKKSKSSTGSGKPTLYDTLGGATLVVDPLDTNEMVEQGYLTIRTIVDTTMFTFASDPLIDTFFTVLRTEDSEGNASEYETLSKGITNFIATAAGCTDTSYTYKGRDLYAAHNPDSNSNIPLAVTDSAFNEFVYDIGQSAINYGLSAQVVSQIGSLLYKYEGQVVQ